MHKLLSWLVGALIFCATTVAASEPAKPECIGLVLGGGGARGAAHVGVLKALERARVPICKVTGTSMGAIAGALYASGYNADQIEQILLAIDWKDMLSDQPPREQLSMRRKQAQLRYMLRFDIGLKNGQIQLPRGVLQGQKFLLLMRRLTLATWNTKNFDDLPIPYRAVGFNLENGETHVFSKGDLALAIRASMSVPALFAPIRVDGGLMADGGALNNVPIDVVRDMGATRVIAVDVSEPLATADKLGSPLAVTYQVLSALMKKRTDAQLATLTKRDLLIQPPLGDMASAEFARVAEAVKIGNQAADAMQAAIAEFGVDEATYAAHLAARPKLSFDPPLIEFVRVLERRSKTARYVESRVAGLKGQPLDPAKIEQSISAAYGGDRYERILWKPKQDENGRTGLEVSPVDKGWGPGFLRFGARLSDDFNGGSAYQFTTELNFTGLDERGAEWRTRLQLGQVSGLRTEYLKPISDSANTYLLPFFDYRNVTQTLRSQRELIGSYSSQRVQIGATLGHDTTERWQTSGSLYFLRERLTQRIGDDNAFPGQVQNGLVLGARGIYDTLDNVQFPKRGARVEIGGNGYQRLDGNGGDGAVFDVIYDHAASTGPHRFLFGLRALTRVRDPGSLSSNDFLGGLTNLSGYADRSLAIDRGGLLRSVYYRRLGDEKQLFSLPVYVGGSLELAAVREPLNNGNARYLYAASTFIALESVFGPIFFGYGRAEDGASSWYLTFGSLLRPSVD
jgi:NTE family protein